MYSSIIISVLLLCNCAFGSIIPSRREIESYKLSGFSRRENSVLGKRALDPPVPTVEVCKGKLSVDKDKAVFYSSAVEKSAQAYADDNGKLPKS